MSACETRGYPVAPTPTHTVVSTVQPQQASESTPTGIAGGEPTQIGPTVPGPTATIVPAATQPTAVTGKEPLTLGPVTVETNDTTRNGALSQERTLNLPPGFHIKVFASSLSGVRWLGLSPEGLVYATVKSEGKVVTLPDADKDGVADSVNTFADSLGAVHGIDFHDGAVYVANESQIIRLEDTDKDGKADKRDVLASDLPSGSGHATRTIAFGPDGKLYVSVGSSCNVCVEQDPKRAAILRYSADSKFEKVYAKGLRNAVGILFHPLTKELWATNNGRDSLGDDTPTETVYNVKEDTDYGWPFCYGDRIPDQSQNSPAGYCEKTGVPSVKMQAHSAPLGLAFYTGQQFPEQFKGDLFVAFHGSWNRSVPTGYKLVRIRMKDNQPDTSSGDKMVEDFATGWFLGEAAWGRPVDPLVAPDGSLLLTDDKANAIYSIYYRENAEP